MDIKSFCGKQKNLLSIVGGAIRKRLPHIPQETLEDGFHNSVLSMLKIKDTIQDGEIVEYLIVNTYDEVEKVYRDHREFQKYVVDNAVPRHKFDFSKFHKFYINSLTPPQKKIYNAKMRGMTIKEMEIRLNMSANHICVVAWYIVNKYKKWVKRRRLLDLDIRLINRLNPWDKEVMLLYYYGYTPKMIAKRVGIDHKAVSVRVFHLRDQLKRLPPIGPLGYLDHDL